MSDFQQLLEENGYRARSYSGRAMYGKTCLGVTVDDIVKSCLDIGYLAGTQDIPLPERVRYDSMGLSYIIYFPGIEYSDNSDEDDWDGDEDVSEDTED